MKEGIEVFREVLTALQQELEVVNSIPDTYRAKDVVKTLSRIQRQAAVMRRALAGNQKVFEAVMEMDVFGSDIKGVVDLASDLKEVAEELESNASESFSLRLTMIDFKSQTNMKIFTYVSVVIAPMSLVTGWFGMNFEEMEELKIPGFYHGVVGVALGIMTLTSIWLFWMNLDGNVNASDAADVGLLLKKAEADEE